MVLFDHFPGRTLIWRNITSEAPDSPTGHPIIAIPFPGAVCPATVMQFSDTVKREVRLTTPKWNLILSLVQNVATLTTDIKYNSTGTGNGSKRPS